MTALNATVQLAQHTQQCFVQKVDYTQQCLTNRPVAC
nr:MAG TPA: hypothetical protein [Caudoviricetes sp.]